MQFYILSNTPADVTQVMRCIMYLMTVLFQGSISFLPASNVEIEAEKLANEIYCLDWYNSPNLKIRKFVLFWLMKAQKPVQMSGGGLMTVNRNVFLQIPRTSFSICTLLG
ncbi:hypothetical protein Zmor_022842 [Zophobas morio]|nr:hypothetical protein Zmor_022842 [Zophobas morio]